MEDVNTRLEELLNRIRKIFLDGERMTIDARNVDEIAYWNGPGGQRWLKRQPSLDALLAPVAAILLDRAAPSASLMQRLAATTAEAEP